MVARLPIIQEKINRVLLFVLLVIYPFGQLFRVQVGELPVVFLDGAVGATALSVLFVHRKRLTKIVFTPLGFLWIVAAFSYLMSLFVIGWDTGAFLYLMRLGAYFLLFVWAKAHRPKRLISFLLIGTGTIAVFGWIQYFFFADLTSLKALGWDDHLYRLTSTLLDPAFTGILLVCGVLLTLTHTRTPKYTYPLLVFFILTTVFTYSRASMLALLVGLGTLFCADRSKWKAIVIAGALLIGLFFILPNRGGEGTYLARTASSLQKIENTHYAIEVISESPVWGVGYNQLCTVKQNKGIASGQHSCYGFDNSYLYIWATTGVVGLMTCIGAVGWSIKRNKSPLFLSTLAAIGFHGLFTNTLVYTWVLVWVAVIWGITADTRS